LGASKSAFRTAAGDLLGGLELPHTSNKKTGTAGKHATRCALLLRFQPESKQLRLRRREDAIRDIVVRAIHARSAGSAPRSRCANAHATSCRLRKRSVGANRRLRRAHFRAKRIDFVARSNQNCVAALT
jgi:hypothetical protein